MGEHFQERNYPEDVKLKAIELAATLSCRQAARQLDIPRGTLQKWIKHPDYAEFYAKVRTANAPKWRERAAATLEELVDGYTQLEVDALENAKQALNSDKMEPRDVANFLRSVAVAKGVNADHVAKLRGQPSIVVERRIDAGQLEQAMAKLLETVDHDGEPEELPALEALPEGSE